MGEFLVLGASGFIGFHLCEELCRNPNNYVIGVDRNIDNIPNRVPLHINIDLTKDKECEYLFNNYEFDTVFQVAADSGKLEYLNSKDYHYGTSTLINLNIIRNLKPKQVKRFIFTSSDYARDTELNDYGLEKKFNEQLYRRSGLPIKIATLSNIYGVWDTSARNEKVLNALCRRTAEAKLFSTMVVSNDGRLRSFVHVLDAVKVLIDMDKDTDIKSQTSISIPFLCELINLVSGKHINFLFNRRYPTDNREIIYTEALVEGIKEVYDYYLAKIKVEKEFSC